MVSQIVNSDPALLAGSLSKRFHSPLILVAVDGLDGAGKSYLAEFLAGHFGLECIGLNAFLNRKRDGFVDHLRYRDLARAIASAMDSTGCIVEGCCVVQALERLGRSADAWVYVKRLVGPGIWLDGDFLEKYDSPSQAISGELADLRTFKGIMPRLSQAEEARENGSTDLSGLTKELIRYHYDYRPHERAHFIYERSESSG